MLGNCCDDSCYYVREKFNRANETPIRSPWEKLLPPPATPNTWNLRDEILDAIDPGTYRYNFAFPGGATDARHASVRFKLTEAGSVELLMAITPSAFLDQPYDWFSAWVYYDAAGCSYLSTNAFYHGLGYGGGVGPGITNSVNAPGLTLNEWHRLEACLIQNPSSYAYTGYNLIIAKLTCANGKVYSCQELSNTGQTIGAHGGLKYRKGSIGTCEFDDYEETYYRDSPTNQHRTCPWCRVSKDCELSSDNFIIDQPCLWDVISGSATRGGGTMVMTSNGSDIQHHIFDPDLQTNHIVTTAVLDYQTPLIRIGNGYARLLCTSAGHTLTLFDNDDNAIGTATDTIRNDSSQYLTAVLCYYRGYLSILVTGHNGIRLCISKQLAATPNGYWVGLGGDSGVTFASFVFSRSYSTASLDKACPKCTICGVFPAPPCDNCCGEDVPDTEYVIDLGDGGWIPRTKSEMNEGGAPGEVGGGCPALLLDPAYDCECHECNDANGEWIVESAGECLWFFGEQACANYVKCCSADCANDGAFTIELSLARDELAGESQCRWFAKVTMLSGYSSGPPCLHWFATIASYKSEMLTDITQCHTMPVTLTKWQETGNNSSPPGGPCLGSLPETITLKSV